MKRIVSLLLVLSFVVALFSVDVFAIDDSATVSDVDVLTSDDSSELSDIAVYAEDQYYTTQFEVSVSAADKDGKDITVNAVSIGTVTDRNGSPSRGYKYTTGHIWLVSLKEGSTIKGILFDNKDSALKIDISKAVAAYDRNAKANWLDKTAISDISSDVYIINENFTSSKIDKKLYPATVTNKKFTSEIPTQDVSGLIVKAHKALQAEEYVYIQIATPTVIVDKSGLETAISKAKSILESDVYTSDDRWNGKDTSKNGFWKDLDGLVKTAQAIYDDPKSTRSQVDTAIANLEAAVAPISKKYVNATVLHEAVLAANKKQPADYSDVTWTPFEAARTAAKELLEKLYDENGDPTELNRGPKAMDDAPEGAVEQKDVDAAAALLQKTEAALYSASADSGNTAILGYAKKMFPALIALAEQAKKADYTTESWTAFAAALEAAKNAKAPTLTGTSADKATVAAYKKAFDDLYEQFYCGLTPNGEIKVSLVYTDPNDPHEYGTAAGARGGATETVTLDGSYSVYDAVQTLANKPTNAVWNAAKIFINGRYVSQNYLDQSQTEAHLGVALSKKIKLHPNDEVVVLAFADPRTTTSQNIGSAAAQLWQYLSSLKTSRFTQGSKLKVEAGQQVTLNVQSTPAALGSGATAEAAANMTLMTSAKVDEPSGSHPTPTIISIDGNAVKTGADGSATLTFYHEGWYLVTAYDLQKDELGAYDASNVGTENRAGITTAPTPARRSGFRSVRPATLTPSRIR